MIRGAIYFDGLSENDGGVIYEVIDGSNDAEGGESVGDDSGSYAPASTDVIILSPRGNIKCWPEWHAGTSKWRFYVSDSSYQGYIFYTIHQET